MQNIESSSNYRFWLDSPLELRFLGLMVSLAFVVPYHLPPIASFYSEFVAFIYGFLAVGLFICNRKYSSVSIPKTLWIPIGIGCVVILQWSLGMFAYQTSALGLVGYMLWAALLMIMGASMTHQYEPAWLVLRLAWFVLCGALVNAVAGVIQMLHWGPSFGGLVMPLEPGQGIFGNLGQQNHYATHMAMGLLSTGVLSFSRCISIFFSVSCSLLFLSMLVMSGSRMALLYVGLMTVLLWIMYSQCHGNTWVRLRKLLYCGVAIVIVFGLSLVLLPANFFSVQSERWVHIGTAFAPRIYLWENAWIMFKTHPILGVGFDDFADQLFHQAAQSRANFFGGLDKSAHNIFFHLLAVSGALGFIVFVLPLGAFVRRQFAKQFPLERMWLLGILAILLIHSLLEQPLFYAYFLGISALALGMADDSSQYKFVIKARVLLSGLSLVLTGALLSAGWDYVDFSRQQKLLATYPTNAPGYTAAKDRMIQLGNHSFLAPYVELNYPTFFISPQTLPEEKLKFSKRVLRFSPIPEAQIRHSLYLFDNGEVAESLEYFSKCALLYPGLSQGFITELSLHPAGYEKWLDLVKGK
jgi:O-antigen ligase